MCRDIRLPLTTMFSLPGCVFTTSGCTNPNSSSERRKPSRCSALILRTLLYSGSTSSLMSRYTI